MDNILNKIREISRASFLALLLSAIAFLAIAAEAKAADFDRSALVEAAKKEGKLVWYSGSPQAVVTKMLASFHEKYPFIDTSEFVSSSAGRVLARVKSEAEAGKYVADIADSGDLSLAYLIDDLVAQWHSPEYEKYPKQFRSPEDKWVGWKATTLLLSYNSGLTNADEIPASWNVLTDPKFSGKIALRDSNSGIMYLQWVVLGEVMGPDFWGNVLKNSPVLFSGTSPMDEAVLRGELTLNGSATAYSLSQYRRQGAPYAGIVPKEGVPVVLYPMMLFKDAPHPNAARLFIDWVLSEEGQSVVVNEIGDYSVREGAPTPEGSEPLSTMKLLTPSDMKSFVDKKNMFVDSWR